MLGKQSRIALCLATIMGLVTFSLSSDSAELVGVNVSNEKNRFFVESQAVLYVPVDTVYDTLMDFDNYERFSSVYKDARWIMRNPDDSGEIYTYTSGCVLFFCKGFERTETVQGIRPQSIATVVDSKRSQGIVGVSKWRLEPEGDSTRLFFDMEFEPNFWVPPLIGPYFIKRMLGKNGAEALQRIETLAIERYESVPQAHSDERGELISIPGNIMKEIADVDAPRDSSSDEATPQVPSVNKEENSAAPTSP